MSTIFFETTKNTSELKSESFEDLYFKNVQSYIDKNDYEQALKYLIPSYDRKVDQDFVKKIYFYLHQIIPNLNKLSSKLNLENLFKCLNKYPDLALEQCYFALDLAKMCQKSNEFYKAMILISKVNIIAEKYSLNNINELYRSVHELFLKSIDDILQSKKKAFKDNLSKALIDNNVVNFNNALLEIKYLESHLCNFEFAREILISLYEYAHNILTDCSWGNKETKQDFAKRFDDKIIIEKVKLREFKSDINKNNFLQKARKDLIDFRKNFETSFKKVASIKDYKLVRELQEKVKKDFIEFFRKNIIEHASAILGPPPCDFDIRAMGSIARAEICPYSDLEFIILIEDEKHIDYFKKMVSIMELIIVSLGETAEKDFVFSCLGVKNKSGFHIDSGANPKNSDLIKTPEGMAEFCLQKEDSDFLLFSLRNTSSLTYENTPSNLFDVFQKELNQGKNNTILQTQFFNRLEKRLDDYKKFDTNINNLKIVNVKNQYTQLINYILLELAIFYKIDLNNPIDIIDSLKELNIFTMNSAILLKEVVSSVYMTRTRLHFLYEEQKEEALLPNQVFISDNFYFLNKEYDQLLSAYWLVLKPLYKIVKEFIKKSKDNKDSEKLIEELKDNNSLKEINFFDMAFDIEISNFYEKKNKESFFLFIKTFIKKLKEFDTSKEIYEMSYKKLSKSNFLENLRKIYLDNLDDKELVLNLKNIPNEEEFSPVMSKEEDVYFEVDKESNVFWDYERLIVDFKEMKEGEKPEIDRQISVINVLYLTFLNAKKPLYLNFSNCDVLNFENLQFFLHENLIELNLHNCPGVNDLIVESIAKKCKNLKKLNVSHCQNIIAIRKEVFDFDSYGFFKLENLDISHCTNLQNFEINTLNLKELKANDNKNLEYANIDIPIACQVNFSNCDKIIANPPSCLLKNKSFINCKDSKGNIPLICAAKTGQIKVIEELLNIHADVDVNVINCEGKTALIYAVHYIKRFNPEIIKRLTTPFIVDIKDNKGKTALMYAIEFYSNFTIGIGMETIEHLINQSYLIDMQDNEGNTALMYAIEFYSNIKIIELLIKRSNVNIRNKEGKTATLIAIEKRRFDVVKILKPGAFEGTNHCPNFGYIPKIFMQATTDRKMLLNSFWNEKSSTERSLASLVSRLNDPEIKDMFLYLFRNEKMSSQRESAFAIFADKNITSIRKEGDLGSSIQSLQKVQKMLSLKDLLTPVSSLKV